MECARSKLQDFTVIAITGEIDLNSSPEMRKTFDDLIKDNATKIIVDFQNVSYIDSSGLATLIEMMQRLKKHQGSMHLVRMADKIRNLFEVTKLDKLFKIYPTQEDVLSAS
ncbi:MAG: STAS domain-containing protein [Candidatus Omnitrophota bacterium]